MTDHPLRFATVGTPPGPLTVLTAGPTVVAAGFTTDLNMLTARIPGRRPSAEDPAEGALPGPVHDAIAAYFDGDLAAWDGLDVARPGSGFQQQAWDALRRVPPGRPVTYTELAARSANPRAVRAAASACARNPIAPFVPCHRVVRRDGGLGGYAFGLPIKQWLLDHESSPTADQSSG